VPSDAGPGVGIDTALIAIKTVTRKIGGAMESRVAALMVHCNIMTLSTAAVPHCAVPRQQLVAVAEENA
jgi:hypothetical protein